MKLGKILLVLSLVLFFQGNYPSPTLAEDKEVKVKPKDKRIIVRKGLVSDDTKLRSVKVYWELPEGDETHKWKIRGFRKSVVPVKYIPNESVSLVVEGGPKNSRAEVRVRVRNQRAGGSTIIFERNLELDFDDKEIGVFSIKMDDLLKESTSRVNQNAFEAWVSVGPGRRKHPAISKNLLHILKQKLILFIPGVFGSRIKVKGHEGEEAFPEWSTGLDWDPEFMWLKCNTSGVPLNEAVWLDLFRKFDFAPGDDAFIYRDLEDRDEVKNPPHYPFLYCDGVRVPHYILRAWPYDWRLKLENAVDRLMGLSSDDTPWPPYAVPPSLPTIIKEAKEGTFDDRENAGPHLYKYMDDKIAIACHSTGGLITRGVLCRQGIEDYVDKAFFINVPFWGAPKAYYVYLSGDMVPFVNNKYMQSLAPNMPIIYYLAPTEKYPSVVAVLPGTLHNEVGRQPNQSVATAFMNELIAEARRKNVYPAAGQIDPWNKGLENAAKMFHRSIQSKPLIGYENCHVFWSLAEKPTPGSVLIDHTLESPIAFRDVDGDSTCPAVSQRADFPPVCRIKIPGDTEHVPAPTTTFVWEKIIEILSDVTPANAGGKFWGDGETLPLSEDYTERDAIKAALVDAEWRCRQDKVNPVKDSQIINNFHKLTPIYRDAKNKYKKKKKELEKKKITQDGTRKLYDEYEKMIDRQNELKKKQHLTDKENHEYNYSLRQEIKATEGTLELWAKELQKLSEIKEKYDDIKRKYDEAKTEMESFRDKKAKYRKCLRNHLKILARENDWKMDLVRTIHHDLFNEN